MDWSWWHSICGLCHWGLDRGISLLHYRGNREDTGSQQSEATWRRHRVSNKATRQRKKGGSDMRIPKVFHPILGVLIGAILFLIGIAVLSAAFVLAYKVVQYAKPFIVEVFSNIIHQLATLMPLWKFSMSFGWYSSACLPVSSHL